VEEEMGMAYKLHIYAQQQSHDDAYIAGTRDMLEALRDAITVSIDTGIGKLLAFSNDGEGYDVHVLCVTDDQAAKLAVPYTDDIASEHGDALWPWNKSLMS
jgi:hypothetical protein